MTSKFLLKILISLTALSLIEVRALAQTLNRPPDVTDKKGQVIDGLKQDDFELLESGKPQRLDFFSIERIEGVSTGVTTATTRPGETVGKAAKAAQPKRTIVFFVDTIHLSPFNVFHVKQTLRKFVDEQMTADDLVRILPGAGNLGVFGQFTQDRTVLRAAIEKLGPWTANIQTTMLTPYIAASVLRGNREAILTGVEIMKVEDLILLDRPLPQLEQELRRKASAILLETTARRTASLATLKAITEQLVKTPGQRMIALFSDGFSLAGSSGSPEINSLQPVISRAAKTGVVIYSFDARGLTPIMMDASTFGVASLRNEVDPSSIATIGKPDVYLSQSARDLEDGMAALSDGTGGEAFFGTNDLSKRLQKALDNNRLYYNLSYYPIDEIEPNKFRKISIQIKDHPEYSVRTQKGYTPAELKSSGENAKALTVPQRLAQAMASPVPSTAIGVYINADYFQREGDDKVLRVDAHIDGENLNYLNYRAPAAAAQSNASGFGFDLVLATAIYDEKGKQVFGVSDQIKSPLPPEGVAAAKRNGFRSARREVLLPGVYQIRVGVFEASTVSPGIYELRILIKGTKGKDEKAIQRAIPFVVE